MATTGALTPACRQCSSHRRACHAGLPGSCNRSSCVRSASNHPASHADAFRNYASSATGFPHLFCGTGLRLSLAGSPITRGRIEVHLSVADQIFTSCCFPHRLATARLHSVSGFYAFPRRAFTSLTCYTPRRTRAGTADHYVLGKERSFRNRAKWSAMSLRIFCGRRFPAAFLRVKRSGGDAASTNKFSSSMRTLHESRKVIYRGDSRLSKCCRPHPRFDNQSPIAGAARGNTFFRGMAMYASNGLAGRSTKSRKIRAGLSREGEARLRKALRRQSPSEPWVEAQFRNVLERDARGQAIIRRFHDPTVFPPGGSRTAMIRCPACDIFMPPGAFEEGVCLDHAEHEGWGPSPSAEAIRGLQHRNLRLLETELPPESASALRREIQEQQESHSVHEQPRAR